MRRLDRLGRDSEASPRISGAAAMTAYDSNNIFAKILRGEFPCHKVYEDAHVLAFLDIMPRVPGHTLVIPKAPARNILDIKVEDYLHVARARPTRSRPLPSRRSTRMASPSSSSTSPPADRWCFTCMCM